MFAKMFEKKAHLNLLEKEAILASLVTPELSLLQKASLEKIVTKIMKKPMEERERLIYLVKKYLDYTIQKKMTTLIKDKLDNTSLTGLSVTNYLASCRNPTEDGLKDVIQLYSDMKKEGFLDADDVNRERRGFISELRSAITAYKNSAIVGKKDDEKITLINEILTVILAESLTDAERLAGVNKVYNALVKSKRYDLDDVKTMFSKACIIIGGLSTNDQLLAKGSIFDEDLKKTTFAKIIGFTLKSLTWCGLSICLEYLSQKIRNWIENEDHCIDKLIDSHMNSTSKSEYQQVIQQLYQARQIEQVSQEQQSCYEMYANLAKKGYLITKTGIFSSSVNTQIKPTPNVDKDDKLLDALEDASSVFREMHKLHDIMSYIKLNCEDTSNSSREIKRLFLALESQFKKIKIEDTSTDSTFLTLGVLKNNQPIFKEIDTLLENIQTKLDVSDSENKTVSAQFSQLTNEINELKACYFSSRQTTNCAKSARSYIDRHFDSKTRSLNFSETSGSQEKSPLLSKTFKGLGG